MAYPGATSAPRKSGLIRRAAAGRSGERLIKPRSLHNATAGPASRGAGGNNGAVGENKGEPVQPFRL